MRVFGYSVSTFNRYVEGDNEKKGEERKGETYGEQADLRIRVDVEPMRARIRVSTRYGRNEQEAYSLTEKSASRRNVPRRR